MGGLQKSTQTQTPQDGDGNFVPYEMLNPTQQAIVDFRAVNGLMTTENQKGKLSVVKYTVERFAEEYLHITRDGYYKAYAAIPNFWDLVNQRRRVIATQSRLAKVHEAWYASAILLGSQGYRDRQAYLANFDDNYVAPNEPPAKEGGNSWVSLLSRHHARKQREVADVQEGEVVDAGGSNSSSPSE